MHCCCERNTEQKTHCSMFDISTADCMTDTPARYIYLLTVMSRFGIDLTEFFLACTTNCSHFVTYILIFSQLDHCTILIKNCMNSLFLLIHAIIKFVHNVFAEITVQFVIVFLENVYCKAQKPLVTCIAE